ncbi:2'-5' RNA ligase family protein [Pimelobacter simplex]|uniref:2'-5' RNA ligase family protein n=1 Tax=Nocardioides simplex TaxID=2045 RepID=UPI00214F7C23|nr:2'-5' RNA ligase family protein [Pimelobacter simplex]UUW88986.1 2'-5' RNA ligase family protein [Pimelobacter simplex]UUW98491.1 2'-5' RNA ligase family protein [Pimelobacter simplex]
MAHSVLAVPVPALEPYVRSRWEHYDPAWVSRDPAFTHAHITVLAPFLPEPTGADLDRVAEVVQTTAAFDFRLAEVATFPDGLVHLVPEPAEPFAELTDRLWRAFPQCPPYAGEYGAVVPHLTLDRVGPGVSVATVERDLAGVLPVTLRADRVELHGYEEMNCRFLLGWSCSG